MLADSGASTALVDETWPDQPLRGAESTRLVGLHEWSEALSASDAPAPVPTPDPTAPAAIAYTSGTTGFPKGAVHCQAGLIQPGAASIARRRWGPDLRKGDSLPLTILNMMVLTTLLTSQAGATEVIMDGGDVVSIAEWIKEESVTVWNGPPAQLHTMAVPGPTSSRPTSPACARCGSGAAIAPTGSGATSRPVSLSRSAGRTA